MFQIKDAIDSLPFNIYDHEKNPVTIYKLIATNKVFEL